MAQGKKSFVIYTSWKVWLEALNNEQKGIWLDWMMSYTNDENPALPDDQAVKLACMVTKDQLKRDLEKWEETKEKRAEAGRKGGIAKSSKSKQMLANATNAKQNLANSSKGVANLAVNVNDNVNVNVLSKDNVNNSVFNNTLGQKTCVEVVDREALFNKFWEEYPKKVGKEKCKNWFLNKTRKVTQELLDQILEGLRKWKSNIQWQKDNGQFIPNPYTWLNRGGWNDIPYQEEFKSQTQTPIVWEKAK